MVILRTPWFWETSTAAEAGRRRSAADVRWANNAPRYGYHAERGPFYFASAIHTSSPLPRVAKLLVIELLQGLGPNVDCCASSDHDWAGYANRAVKMRLCQLGHPCCSAQNDVDAADSASSSRAPPPLQQPRPTNPALGAHARRNAEAPVRRRSWCDGGGSAKTSCSSTSSRRARPTSGSSPPPRRSPAAANRRRRRGGEGRARVFATGLGRCAATRSRSTERRPRRSRPEPGYKGEEGRAL